MPCRVDGPLTPAEEELQHYTTKHIKEPTEEIEKLTRFLCEYDREVRKTTENNLDIRLIEMNLSPELTEWLKKHRVSDAKRKNNAMVDFQALAKKLGYNLQKIEIE